MKKATPLQSRPTNDTNHNTKTLAQGNWTTILTRFGADVSLLNGKHRPCPSCGGTDRFRFDDREGTGTHICSQCGAGDGFALIQKMCGYGSFKETAAAIDSMMDWHGEPLSSEQKQEYKAKVEKQRLECIEAESQAHTIAAKQSLVIWEGATIADNTHPYLIAKGVSSYGLKVWHGKLIVPVRIGGEISSLQYIAADGGKMFAKGGNVSGGYYSIAGDERASSGVAIICEGYATGASIREATGQHVAVAYNASNLIKVAKVIRDKLPNAQITIAADNDLKTDKNTGLGAAIEAAKAVGGKIALPAGKEGFSVDFNDTHQQHGLETVKAAMANAVQPDMLSIGKGESSGVADLKLENTVGLKLIPASSITMERIDWLWHHFLAKGKLHIFAGQAGTGKTTIALNMAATVTTGGKWADRTRAPVGSVLIWSGEDDPADSLIPRLVASGADLGKVFFVGDMQAGEDSRAFDPSSDMPYLLNAVRDMRDLALIIVDPIVSAVSGDSHKNAEVRKSLQPLVDMGMKANAAILGITHFSKGSKGADPAERVTGSLAFGALARLVMCTVKPIEEDAKPRFIRSKSNISPDGGGFEYLLQRKDLGNGIEGQHIEWGDALEGTATELMAEIENGERDSSAFDDAMDWLQDILKEGRFPQKEIREAASAHCHAWRTIERAKKTLEIESKKLGKDWFWKLPYHSWESDEEQMKRGEKEGLPPHALLGGLEHKTPSLDGKNVVTPTKKEHRQPPQKRTPPKPLGGLEFKQKEGCKTSPKIGELGTDGKIIGMQL